MTRNREIDCQDIFGCDHNPEIPITNGNGDIVYWQCRCGDKKVTPPQLVPLDHKGLTDADFKVTWSEDDKEYIGTCVQFPSLSWLNPNEQEALEGIKKLVRDVIQDMKRI